MVKGLFDERVSVRALAVLRILVGPIALVHLWPFWQQAQPGVYFAEIFHVPFFSWWPLLPLEAYRAMIALAMLGSVTMSLGLFTRASCGFTLGVVAYNVLSNQLFFHHNRAFLITILFGLTLTDCGRVLSLDAWRARRRGRPLTDATPLWRLVLFRALACTPYLASGFSKLIDPDWWSGTVMYDRIDRYRHIAEARGVPTALIDPIATPGFNAVMWKLVVLTELFIGIGYWFGRTRLAAMFMALGFHVLIEITSTVSVFSYLGIVATLIWVTPNTRDRTLTLRTDVPSGRRLRALVRGFDWLARFRIVESTEGPPIHLQDRDGTEVVGSSARRLVLSRLPVFFPFVAPLLLVRGRGGGWRWSRGD